MKHFTCDRCGTKASLTQERQTYSLPEGWRALILNWPGRRAFQTGTRVSIDHCIKCTEELDLKLKIDLNAPDIKSPADILYEVLEDLVEKKLKTQWRNR